MTAFFTTEELAWYLQVDESSLSEDTALLLADLASAAVRDDLNQLVDFVADEDIVMYGDGTELLLLPQRPVVDLTAITLDGEDILASIDIRANGALRRVVYTNGPYVRWPYGGLVEITYSHGFAVVPDAIKAVALALTAGAYSSPVATTSSQTAGPFSVTYQSTASAVMALSEEQRTKLDRYRALDL